MVLPKTGDGQPSILHIFTDQQRFDTIRALGNPIIITPNLRTGGETAGLDGDGWKLFPKAEIQDDPDTGLMASDYPVPRADLHIPGYTDK
jgi:hypothetical protein